MQLFKNITQIFFFWFSFFIKLLIDYLLLELIFSDQVKATLTEVCVCVRKQGEWWSGVCNQIKIDCGKRIRTASDETVPFFFFFFLHVLDGWATLEAQIWHPAMVTWFSLPGLNSEGRTCWLHGDWPSSLSQLKVTCLIADCASAGT